MITLDYMTDNDEFVVMLADVLTKSHSVLRIPVNNDVLGVLRLVKEGISKLSLDSLTKLQHAAGL